jgi:hypothetical protein
MLPLTDSCKGDRATVLAQGQIDHGGHGKPAFGGETHVKLLKAKQSVWLPSTWTRLNPTSVLKYTLEVDCFARPYTYKP